MSGEEGEDGGELGGSEGVSIGEVFEFLFGSELALQLWCRMYGHVESSFEGGWILDSRFGWFGGSGLSLRRFARPYWASLTRGEGTPMDLGVRTRGIISVDRR